MQTGFRILSNNRVCQTICEQEEKTARIYDSLSRFVASLRKQSEWHARRFQQSRSTIAKHNRGVVAGINICKLSRFTAKHDEDRRRKTIDRGVSIQVLINPLG